MDQSYGLRRAVKIKNMKKLYTVILVALSVIVLSWFLPWLYSIAFPVGGSDPFIAYSPVSHKFVVSETYESKNVVIYSLDENGRREAETFTKEQRDSLLPQIYFTQLMAREQMPDSIDGFEMSVSALKHNQWVFSSIPRDINKVMPKVYMIMESMPARIDLEDPKEVFRFRKGGEVEFIDMETAEVVPGKSRRFTEIFKDRGFKLPVVSSSANITSRKPYDEGYLMVDAAGEIYHLKMQAGRPYMMKLRKPDSICGKHVFIMENVETRHLGLMTDTRNNLYVIEREGYRIVPLNVGKVDPTTDKIAVVKNIFNWVVKITNNEGVRWTALDSDDYSRLAGYSLTCGENKSEKIAGFIFPFTMSFTDVSDCYAFPRIENVSFAAIILNIILALVTAVVLRRRKSSPRATVSAAIATLVFGIYSFIPFLVLKN